jgi:hypothetical protein
MTGRFLKIWMNCRKGKLYWMKNNTSLPKAEISYLVKIQTKTIHVKVVDLL